MNGPLVAAVVSLVGLAGAASCGPSSSPTAPSTPGETSAPAGASGSPSPATLEPSVPGACSRLARRMPPARSPGVHGPVPKPTPPELHTEIPPAPTDLRELVRLARLDVEQFFGVRIEQPYKVLVLPDRALFDELAQERWQVPATPCWLVAAGSATSLTIVNPAVWQAEACDHDPSDTEHVRRVIAHEIVHVLCDQRNPAEDLESLRRLDWLVEGVAVLGSGQLDARLKALVAEEIGAGRVPKTLAEAFAGPARYAIAASLVAYVDERLGREGLVELLALGAPDDVLDRLGMTELELLHAWRVWISLGAH